MFEQYDDILTIDESCEALKIGKNALYKLLNEGKIKAFRNGKCWRIPKMSIVDYIYQNSFKRMG